MTWYIIAPDHKVATAWMKDNHPDIPPYSTADVKIVTPHTADNLRGVRFREGDRLIRINDDWLPATPGVVQLYRSLMTMSATSPVKIETEWVEW